MSTPAGQNISYKRSRFSTRLPADLWVVELNPNAKPRNITAQFDFDVGAGVFGDNAAPRAGGSNIPLWSPDGRSILEIYGKEGRMVLAQFDLTTGRPTDLTHGNQAVVRFRATTDLSRIVCSIFSLT